MNHDDSQTPQALRALCRQAGEQAAGARPYTGSVATASHHPRLWKLGLAGASSLLALAVAWAPFGSEADGTAPPATQAAQRTAAPPAWPAPAEPAGAQSKPAPIDLMTAPAAAAIHTEPADEATPAGNAVPADTRTPEEQVSQPGGAC